MGLRKLSNEAERSRPVVAKAFEADPPGLWSQHDTWGWGNSATKPTSNTCWQAQQASKQDRWDRTKACHFGIARAKLLGSVHTKISNTCTTGIGYLYIYWVVGPTTQAELARWQQHCQWHRQQRCWVGACHCWL